MSISSIRHMWTEQVQIGKLPPLYLSSYPSDLQLKKMECHWNTILLQYRDMQDAVMLNTELLHKELSEGISKEKRLALQEYVSSVVDPSRRAMLELWLARFPGFVLRVDRMAPLEDVTAKDTRLGSWRSLVREWKFW